MVPCLRLGPICNPIPGVNGLQFCTIFGFVFLGHATVHRQNVKVKNAETKQRRRTKHRKTKCRMGQNVEWKKRRMGQNVEWKNRRMEKTSTGTKRRIVRNIEWADFSS
jgi:hypothetical protein